jgi:ferredoxin/flavodoxin---NADP+ reductase
MLMQTKQNKLFPSETLNPPVRVVLSIVKEVRKLTSDTFVLVTTRNGMQFIPGQRVKINLMNDDVRRPYSIYSGTNGDTLEFLIREVSMGNLSPRLKPLLPGDPIEIVGPNGHFMLSDNEVSKNRLLFIASGTGIAPFHSMVKSYPRLDYTLLHGVRTIEQAYERNHYSSERLIVCTSRDNKGDYQGRVTSYLQTKKTGKFDHIFLCGNNEMIKDSIAILLEKGYSINQIHTEVYF